MAAMALSINHTPSSFIAQPARANGGRSSDAYAYSVNFVGDAEALVNCVDLTTAYRPAVSERRTASATAPAAARSWEQDALSMLARQVSDYEGEIARLKASTETLAAEREGWKQAAREAEARPEPDLVGATAHGKYNVLKHTLAKLLHPDTAHGSMAEKSVREAIFSEFWSAVERIEQSNQPA